MNGDTIATLTLELATAREYLKACHGIEDTLTKAVEENDTLTEECHRYRRILRAILAADERGQGLPFQEAMDEARKVIP